MRAIRATAATKIEAEIGSVRASLLPARPSFVKARRELGDELDELLALLDECGAQIAPHLPVDAAEDSDDYY